MTTREDWETLSRAVSRDESVNGLPVARGALTRLRARMERLEALFAAAVEMSDDGMLDAWKGRYQADRVFELLEALDGE